MHIHITYDAEDNVLSFTAAELSAYLKKMDENAVITCNTAGDGSTLALTVMPRLAPQDGIPAADSALDDRYRITVKNGGGSIAGTNARAVLLGSYRFLYLLGCRFLRPGNDGEIIPSVRAENWTAFQYAAAALRHRGVCIEGAVSYENVRDFVDWLPKLGYNAFFVQFKTPFSFFSRWYTHTFNPFLPPEVFTQTQADELYAKLDGEMAKRGILRHRVGHGWTASAVEAAAGGWEAAGTELTAEQANRLALVNGTRGFFGGIPANTNLCYSNPEAVSAFIDTVTAYAQEHPDTEYLHVWLADEPNNMCECDRCRKTTPADQYVELLDKLDARLTAAGIGVKIVFLLYQELLWTPLRARLQNNGRFVLMFAPISRTFEKSYAEAGRLPPVPVYERNRITLPASLEENLAHLKNWQRLFDGDSFVYDYPLGRAHYGDLGYLAISRVISRDIKQLRALGLNGYLSCQELRAFLPNSLPNYVMGLTLFDTEADFEQIAGDYFAGAAGSLRDEYRAFLETLSAHSSCDYFNGRSPRVHPPRAQEYRLCVENARAFAAFLETQPGFSGLPAFKDIIAYHSSYAILLAQALQFLASGDADGANRLFADFCEFIRKNEPAFQRELDVYRVIEVAVKYTGFTLNKDESSVGYPADKTI